MTEPDHAGDMAQKAAEALREEQMAEIVKANQPLELEDKVDVMAKIGTGLFSRLEFKWRDSDERVLNQVRAATNAMYVKLFAEAFAVVDDLYAAIRKPKFNDHGVVVVDSEGRMVWEVDEHTGQPLEDWESLDGLDIERCLFRLARLRMNVAAQVNELLMEAMFAKKIHTDTYDDAYVAMLDGTIQDRTSKANRKSREDNYHAFFRYVLWSQGDAFLRELKNFQWVLEKTRDWRIRSQWR